jgi:hypothetical protein
MSTLNQCARTCHETPGCVFFAHDPNYFCEMWRAEPDRSDDVLSWNWYDMDCFDTCDEAKLLERDVIIPGPAEGGEMPPTWKALA